MRTVVIGVGNPLRGDDGVGLEVARQVRERAGQCPDLTVTELCAGGLRLMEAMVGFDRAVVVDAMTTAAQPPGTVRELDPETGLTFPVISPAGGPAFVQPAGSVSGFASSRNLGCAHDADLGAALALARALGMVLPGEIRIFGIEAAEWESFREALSPQVRQAVPALVDRILALAASEGGNP